MPDVSQVYLKVPSEIETLVASGDRSPGAALRGAHAPIGAPRAVEHLVVPPNLTLAEAHEITDRIEARIRIGWPAADVTIHPEPDDGRFLGPKATGSMSSGHEGEQRPR